MSNIYQQHRPTSGDSDLYLKLKDGDKVKLRLASDPAISVFKPGDRPRYSWIVFNRELNKPQVYSSGVSVYSQIGDLAEEWGDPQGFDVVIKRTGSGMNDTSYSVTPVKESNDLTKDQLAEINKIDLPQAIKGKWLEAYIKDDVLPDPITSTGRSDDVAPMPTDDDAPIDLNDIPF